METGVVTIQEPVSTKTNVGEAPAGATLDNSSMEVHKANLSTILDDEITSGDSRNNIIPGETDVTKTISVAEDCKIVKGAQDTIYGHEPRSFNKTTEDEKIISSDVTLEMKKEDDITGKPEELLELRNRNLLQPPEEIPIKTDEVKEEKDSRAVDTSVNGTEAEHNVTVSVEEVSRNGDNIVNETVPEDQTATDGEPLHDVETTKRVLLEVKKDDAEQISREVTVDKGKEEGITQNTEEVQKSPRVIETPTIKGEDIESKASLDHEEEIDKISKETVPEKETATDGESLHEIETTKRVLPEAEKEEDKDEMKTDEEPRLNVIENVETVNVKTVIDDPEIVNIEETTVHESESLKEKAEPVEAIKSLDDAEQTSREVTVNRAKEEEITQNTEEIQVNPSLIETSKIQGEDNESKVSLDTKEEVDHSSNETEEHEHVLGRDLPQCETLEVEAVETKEETKPSLDLKEDKEKEETETVKTVISSNEVSSSSVQEEEFGEHTDPCSSEIKDESHGREEYVEVQSKETVQDENTAEKHKDLLDVSSTESEKCQGNEPETTIVANTESHEKFEESPSDLALNVDKEEQKDGTQIMQEQRGLDSKGVEAEQIDRNRTDETEESPVAKQVSLPDVEPVEQMQKPSLDSPSQVSEETSKNVDANIDEKPEEEKVTLHQEDQEEGSYGLETKKETVSVPESIETGEKSQEERNVIDLTPLQEESSQSNEKKEEPKLETHELTNEEVIEVSSASVSKELEGETVVEAEKIENKKENEEEAAAVDNIQKSLETVETVGSHNPLPSSLEEQEHGTVSEKIEYEKVEEVPMVQIKSHERQEEVSKAVEEQNIDIEPSLTATNGESLHDVETTERVLLDVEKEEEEAEIMTDAEPRLDAIEKKEIETAKIVIEDIEIVNNEEATSHESEILKGDDHEGENAESVEAVKNSDDAEKILGEVTGDREKDEDITQKAEEVQESPRVIEIPTIQGEDNESKSSLELKEEVYQSSKDTEQHENVLERDIPQCETLEAEAVDTSTVQEAAILNTLETNISETEAVHSEMGQETKEDTETSLDLKVDKEQKEAETVKTVIFSDEVKSSDQAEEFGEHTEPYTPENKNESQGREESVEIKSKDTVQDESSEEKDVNLPDVRSGESEKYQENEPVTSLVSKTERVDKFEEIASAVEGARLNESTHNQNLVDVESVEKVQKPSLETPSEPPEQTSKTVDEKIEEKTKEEGTLHQEGQEEGYNGLETKEETVSVPESRELGEKAQEEVKLQKEQMEKHEPTEEEVSNDQQSPVEEKFDDVIQVSSASPSEGPEDETVVKTVKIGEEQVADKMTVETSSLLSSSEEQEHATVPEKTDGEEVKEAEPIGDMRERGLEIAETTHLISLPSVDQKEYVKAFDEEIQIPSVTLPLEDQEKVSSTEKGETKANETEVDKPVEHVDSSTSPMFSAKNDDETQISEAEKRDEEITVGTSKTSETVCMQKDDFEKLEATKLEELKEDKSQEIAEITEAIKATSDQTLPIKTSQPDNTPSYELMSEQDDQTPKQVEEIYEEEHKVEATGDRNLPQAYQTPSSDLVSALNDQTPKQVEETHEKETKEEHKLQAEEILPTETIPRDSYDDVLVSMLDGQVTLQEDNCADDVGETKDTQEERPVFVDTEKSVGEKTPKEPEDEMRDEDVKTQTSPIISETLTAEAKKGDEAISETETTMALDTLGTSTASENVCIKQEELVKHEAPKLEEPKEEKNQDTPETAGAIEATVDQNLSIKTSQEDQTLSSELVSGLDDQTPRQVEQIQEEEEANKGRKFEGTGDQSLPVETSLEYHTAYSDLASGLDDQTPQQVEEVHAEETKEEHKLQVAVDQILPVETSQADQTPSLVSEHENQTSKQVEEIQEEETKVTHKVQAEEILSTETVPRELFSETPVSMLASGEDEPVAPQEGNTADDTQVEQHVSAETEERVGDTKPKESEAEGTKQTDVEVDVLTNDYSTEEAAHGDETYSTLPVVGILTELQTTLETEREINDFASLGENIIKEPVDQEQRIGDAEVESHEKDFVSDIKETNKSRQDEIKETEKIQEENGLAGKSLPIEELNLQEEHKEEVKVQDSISREFDVNVEENLQEETKEIAEELPGEEILNPSSALPSEELEHVISGEKQEEREPQQDDNASTLEKITLQEEHSRDVEITNKEQKEETHETVKDDFVSRDVEKEDVPHSVLENEEEVVTSEKQITDPVGVIKKSSEADHESNEEHVETQALPDYTKRNNDRDFTTEQAPKNQRDEVSPDEEREPKQDDTKRNDDRDLSAEEAPKEQREEDSADKYLTKELQVPSSTVLDDFQENSNSEALADLVDRDLSVQRPSELIQSPNQVEETSFEVKKAQEDKNEETIDALIKNVQVQDQPKDYEAPAMQREISEQEQKSNDLTNIQEDIGTNVKPAVHNDETRGDSHDSVVMLKEETGLIEEKREVEHVKTELDDAIKHGVSVEEKNKTSEYIDRQAAKEINQEESKQTYTIKEDIREEEKEKNQESFENVKKTDDAIEKTQPEIQDIESLSSVGKTQDNPEQKDEVLNRQEREIADEVPNLENLKIAEEVQQKDGETENTKDLFSEVKETEPTLKEPARKSLSDLIQKVKGTNKTEDATTEPHIEEKPKTVEEDENDDGDHEHDKDDKTSPDSIVMVEAKDTVSIIKTHKKSQGILSGVGSKVKHSISKVKKVLTGKSSHTTKPSSPK